MQSKLFTALGLVTFLVAGALSVGCGEREADEPVVEGEPLEIGEVRYNVLITRFLNPDDVSDSEYLVGAPEEPVGESYLGVFIQIVNEGEEATPTATDYTVVDSESNAYKPIELEGNTYALEPGAEIDAEGELPAPDTTASEGAIQGALLLYLVEDGISENRPLELDIQSDVGDGVVELDI